MRVAVGERHFRQNGDAVIAFLAEDEAVREAEIGHEVMGEQLGRDLDLLQAEHVGVDLGDDAPERLLAQADRVGVPGGDLEVHVWGASQLGPAAAGSDAGSAVLGAKGPVSSEMTKDDGGLAMFACQTKRFGMPQPYGLLAYPASASYGG